MNSAPPVLRNRSLRWPSLHSQHCDMPVKAQVEAEWTILLAGNPNCGKSTLFNLLTGSHQHVGNWPGKTVEMKEGLWVDAGRRCRVIDLPGTYSLTAYSMEEIIARDAILNTGCDLVVIVLDAANLERNLYLVVQILEMGVPALLALNMWDMALANGIHIDTHRLSERLHVPVASTTLSKGAGLPALKENLSLLGNHGGPTSRTDRNPIRLPFRYSPPLEEAIAALADAIQSRDIQMSRNTPRWLAIKLLEGDAHLLEQLGSDPALQPILDLAARLSSSLCNTCGEEVEVLIAAERYGWINNLTHEVVYKTSAGPSLSERIDWIVTHRWLGIPIFLLVMYMLFRITSEIPLAYVDWLEGLVNGPLSRWLSALFSWAGLGHTWIEHLVVQGLLTGVGGVLAFVPVLAALYLGLGLLEDSGYMARAAFVVDRLMHTLGLHGKSFLPMIVGFGCSVPGIYATRTMESRRERILTGLLVPFMSCSARLPVYLLITAIFFPRQAGTIIFCLYLGGIVAAILVGQVLNRTLFRGMPEAALIMELPDYHRPVLKNIARQTWERTSGFLQKAGTTILTCSLLIWLLMAIPVRGTGSFTDTPVNDSLFAVLSQAAAPIFKPLGFGNWQSTGALMTGVVAKEVVVSTLAQAYVAQTATAQNATAPSTANPASAGQPQVSFLADLQQTGASFAQATLDTLRSIPLLVGIDLRRPAAASGSSNRENQLTTSLQEGFTLTSAGHISLAALAFLVFVLLYTPCVSALTVARHELGTRWMLLTAFGQFSLAWLAGMLVFQTGLLLAGG